ncbi:hypothetical protein EKH55_5714 (plasmid) [Sinorhizobium alkalisoli]|nr:hypothetical protein EKH55_5714 [Sinorhizobium alkalisoli]
MCEQAIDPKRAILVILSQQAVFIDFKNSSPLLNDRFL